MLFVSTVLIACLFAIMSQLSSGALLRSSSAWMMEKRLKDARDLQSIIMSRSAFFREMARDNLAHSLAARSETRGLGSGLGGLGSGSLGGVTGGLSGVTSGLGGAASGSGSGALSGVTSGMGGVTSGSGMSGVTSGLSGVTSGMGGVTSGSGMSGVTSGLSGVTSGSGSGALSGVASGMGGVTSGSGLSGVTSGMGGVTSGSGMSGVTSGLSGVTSGSGSGALSGVASGMGGVTSGSGLSGVTSGMGGVTSGSGDMTSTLSGVASTAGGMMGGSSSDTGAHYVRIVVHEDADCSAAIQLQAMFGVNICMQLDATVDASVTGVSGPQSMMYTYDSLLLEAKAYADADCKEAMSSMPIAVVANLMGTCTAGVKVDASTTPFPHPQGCGELICEYVSNDDCVANMPIQSLWVLTSDIDVDATVGVSGMDAAVASLSAYIGDVQTCVNTVTRVTTSIGAEQSSASVYMSIKHTD
jgi:hypothetical protein